MERPVFKRKEAAIVPVPGEETSAPYIYQNYIYSGQNVNKRSFRKIRIAYKKLAFDEHQCNLFVEKFDFDRTTESFIKKISYVFDEIELISNNQGRIIEIKNSAEILDRWIKCRDGLYVNHKGAVIETYFNIIDGLFSDQSQLIGFIEQNKMYGLYFNGMWGSANENYSGLYNATLYLTQRHPGSNEQLKVTLNSEQDENIGNWIFEDQRGLVQAEFLEMNHELMVKHELICLKPYLKW